jgi:hypothetical protein
MLLIPESFVLTSSPRELASVPYVPTFKTPKREISSVLVGFSRHLQFLVILNYYLSIPVLLDSLVFNHVLMLML